MYSINHVEKYGHGKPEMNDLADDEKVKFQDHDGYFDVYHCDSDEMADKFADWYLSLYESYPQYVTINKIHNRYFTIEINELHDWIED